MSYVLTFVAGFPNITPLSEDFPSFLHDFGYDISGTDWLDKEIALDVFMNEKLSHDDLRALRHKLMDHQIDVFLTEREGRQKKLLVADMDSTIVVGETLDELSAFAGVKDRVEEITRRAMNGEMDFEEALKQRVSLLKNLSVKALKETSAALQIMRGAKQLIRTMKKSGAQTILVTGGFTYFADDVGKEVGFHHVHGNQLKVDDRVITGAVTPPILDKNAKLAYLKDYAAKFKLDLSETFAIGDGANDLPMLEAAGLGIGYHSKDIVQQKLLNVILHGNLTAALYAQGYKNLASE